MTDSFIDPSWIKTSDYPTDFLPAGSIAIDQASENGDYTVKGFYDPKTGEYHIQEVVHNGEVRGASRLAGEASSAEGATSTVVLGAERLGKDVA